MKYHKIAGLPAKECECRFCGRALEFLSTDESKHLCINEHLHFTLVDHFYAKCSFCNLARHFNVMHEHAATSSGARKLAHYRRSYGPAA